AQLIFNLINGMSGRPVGAAGVNCIRFGVISLDLPREQDRKLARDFAEVLDRMPAGHHASWFESQVAHRPVMVRILLRPERVNGRHLAGTKGPERTYLGLGGCYDLGPDLLPELDTDHVEILHAQRLVDRISTEHHHVRACPRHGLRRFKAPGMAFTDLL